MAESLRKKTIQGVAWSTIERFSLQTIQFIINIIMARLLLPSDYGMIGMLAIFLQLSQTFIDCGFTNALIQRKERTEVDFSTVFYCNVLIAIILYGILYFSAPLIANFYKMPQLTLVTRIIALNFIFASFSAIHKIKLTINIDFKTQSKASLTAAIVSGSIGITTAYIGMEVWALVIQSILNSLLLTILLCCFLKWKPLKKFSLQSFKSLFSFGSKLMIANFINIIYRNLYTLIIGKKFSAITLGYYTRAEQFASFPPSNINSILSRVIYPILSSIQEDNDRLANTYRKYIQLASFVIFPLMTGVASLAHPIISILLTNKWIGVVTLLQILCFDWMFDHISTINLNLLYVKGRSDLSLRLEIIKKTIAIVILFISIPFGIQGMCWGRVVYSLIATYANCYYTQSLIGLTFKQQIYDILPYFALALSMGAIIIGIVHFIFQPFASIIVGILVGMTFYLLMSYLFKMKAFEEILRLIHIKRI